MSRPCDTGLCDPDNCYDVGCKSDIESVPEKEETDEDLRNISSEHENEREK